MDIKLVPNNDEYNTYNLYVNGKLRLKEETSTVCQNVIDSLNGACFIGECQEIADNIKSDL